MKLDSNLLGNFSLDGPIGSNIKSIQRGVFTGFKGTNAYVGTIPITGVDITKSIVRLSYCPNAGTYNMSYTTAISANLTGATTLELRRSSQVNLNNDTTFDQDVYWEVIEFNNVKSIQRGSILSSGTYNLTITSVNPNKSMIFTSQISDTGADRAAPYLNSGATFASSTSVTFKLAPANVNVYWQIIEFS